MIFAAITASFSYSRISLVGGFEFPPSLHIAIDMARIGIKMRFERVVVEIG